MASSSSFSSSRISEALGSQCFLGALSLRVNDRLFEEAQDGVVLLHSIFTPFFASSSRTSSSAHAGTAIFSFTAGVSSSSSVRSFALSP
jgi:hypothetical protein